MHYSDCYSVGPFHALGGIVDALLWLIFILVALRIWKRYKNGSPMNWRSWRGDGAEDLLKERFVKGEISREEYEEKLRVIRPDASTDKKS